MSSNFDNNFVYAFPATPIIPPASLLDQSLITLARIINTETITSISANASFPLHLKEHLLSYIVAYRPPGLTAPDLQALVADPDHIQDSLDRSLSEIRRLDLSRSIGSRISFGDLSQTCIFPSLTHLCLAHPGPEISWSSLIAFAEEVPSLTHLSLAYWPMPERTTQKPYGLLSASLYLRRLSETLTRLKYLDIEGCNDWRAALAFGPDDGIDWTGPWKLVNSLNLSQGPMPLEVSLEGGLETEEWIRREVLAKRIEAYINNVRKKNGWPDALPIHVEHGWGSENFILQYTVDKAYESYLRRGCHEWLY